MEINLGDSKGIDRGAMPQGIFTPSTSGIVDRTFEQTLVLAFDEKCFLN